MTRNAAILVGVLAVMCLPLGAILFPSVIERRWERIGPTSPYILQLVSDRTSSGFYAVSQNLDLGTGELYHTTDPGRGWHRLRMDRVRRIAVHPRTAELFVLRDSNEERKTELWASKTRGQSFEFRAKWPFVVTEIFPHPGNPKMLFALGFDVGPGRIGFSTDGGETWTPAKKMPRAIGDPHPEGGKVSGYGISDLAISPFDPNEIYASGLWSAVGGCCDTEEFPITMKSGDGGNSWKFVEAKTYNFFQDPNFPERVFALGLFQLTRTGWTRLSDTSQKIFASVPGLKNELFGLSNKNRLQRSTDGGRTWGKEGLKLDAVASDLLVVGGRNETLIAGSSRGILCSAPGGKWAEMNSGFREAQFDFIYSAIGRTYAKTSGSEPDLYRSDDNGQNWKNLESWREIFTRQKYTQFHNLVVDPSNGSRLILSRNNELWISKDAGETWREGARGAYMISAIDPGNPQVLYFIDSSPLGVRGKKAYKSVDGGKTVFELPIKAKRYSPLAERIFVDPFDYQTVYFLSSSGLFQSRDGGRSVNNISSSAPPVCAVCEDLEFTDMVFLNRPGAFLVLSVSGYVYRTDDGGKMWQQTRTPRIVYPTNIFTADSSGTHFFVMPNMYETKDGGETWRRLAPELGSSFYRDNGGNVFLMTDPKIRPVFLATNLGIYREIVP